MLVEFIMRLLATQGLNWAGNIRIALAVASSVGSVFAATTYYLPYLVNKKYKNTKVLGGLSFLSFWLTSSSVTVLWLLTDLDPELVNPLAERYGYSVFQALLTVISVYFVLQAGLIGLAIWFAHKDIKVFR